MIRVNMDGTGEQEIHIRFDFRPAAGRMMPNAIASDGKIALSIAEGDSWFNPLGVLDPHTGRLEKIWSDIETDIFGAWTRDGRITAVSISTHSELWRFTPNIAGR